MTSSHSTSLKIDLFNLARLLLLSTVLLTTIFLRQGQEVMGVVVIAKIYGVLFISFVLTLINISFWHDPARAKYLVTYQLVYDLLLTSYLVYLTGVSDSIFLFLYLINIVFSATVFRLNGSLFVAGVSGLVFAFIYCAQIEMEQATAWYNLAHNELLFLLTALLSGQLMDQLFQQKAVLESQKASIRKLELLTDQLLNNVPLGLIALNKEEYVEIINQTALKILQFPHPPEVRLKYYELLPELKGTVSAWPKMTEAQKLKFQFQVPKNPSSKFSLQIIHFPVSLQAEQGSDAKSEISYILVFQDVSKMLELESRLEQESRLAATGQLAAGIAHEIRNPLASISGSIETLNGNLKLENEQDKKLISISLREIRRLNNLISDFLEFAKPKESNITEFALADLISEVSETIEKGLPQTVRAEFHSAIPRSLMVVCDREQLKQIFFNLFNNSLQAIRGESLTVKVEAMEGEGRCVVINVIDDGQGIPEHIRSRIFDPFFTTKSTGTGLGLSTVAKIVSAYKGEIKLMPASDGTHFHIRLPRPPVITLAAAEG